MALLQIPIPKSKESIEVDTSRIPEDFVEDVYIVGLKGLLNRGMTNVTLSKLGSEEEVIKVAMEVATENLQKLYDGEIRHVAGRKAKSGENKEVQAEARKGAQIVVRDSLKDAGHKISRIKSSEITRLVNELLKSEEGKPIWEDAKAVIAARKEKKDKGKGIKINLAGVKEDAELVAKGEAKKKKDAAAREAKKAKAAGKAPAEAVAAAAASAKREGHGQARH